MIGLKAIKLVSRQVFITRQITRRKKELLNQFGIDTRQYARASMKRVSPDSKQTSQPGRPPFVRSREPNVSTIRHQVDNGKDRVTVAPVKRGGLDVPGRLERGGVFTRKVKTRGGQQRVITYQIKPRPYMRPAGMKALKDLQLSVLERGLQDE